MSGITEKEKKNYAYYHLVDQAQPNDFLGMVAYSIYKKSKVEYIEKYRKDHRDEAPDEDQIFEWQQSQCTPQQIDLYKEKSAHLIAAFVNNAIEAHDNKIRLREAALLQQKEEIEKRESIIFEKERLIKKKEIEVKDKEDKAKKMSRICPDNRNKLGTYLIAVSQSLVATFIYIIITIVIFIQQKWPIDLINNISANIDKIKP